VVDALFRNGLSSSCKWPYADAIAAINATERARHRRGHSFWPDADVMGEQTGAVVRADAIVTFTAPVRRMYLGC